MNDALRPVQITRFSAGAAEDAPDVAAVEEPLEIRLNGRQFVVIMRTPGADRELATGFLLSERIITGADDLLVVRHCEDAEGEHAPNVLNVMLADEAASRLDATIAGRRAVTATSACGVCGRRTIEDLMAGLAPVGGAWRVPARLIDSLTASLRVAQSAFSETGGLHAAGLFDCNGRLVAAAEDVGRHNAVDKVIGAQVMMERLPLDERLLFVSGRASYEIVQKALVARVPLVAAVSAPSSLAIELSREAGLTLLGFVRNGSFNVYTGIERVDVP